jgi:hypothetical protein
MGFDPILTQQSSHPAAVRRPIVQVTCFMFTALLLSLLLVAPAHARGEKVIPQVADGAHQFRTKIDITNLSSSTSITRMKLYFYQSNSTPWSLATNIGTSNEFLLDIGHSQTLRVETLATASEVSAGYAIIRDAEENSASPLDFQIGVSVFYEVLDGGRIVDTVSVPVGEPTLRWAFPVEIDASKGIYSGFAIVNLGDTDNRVRFRLSTAVTPASADASDGGTVEFTLKGREQKARFLSESMFFPRYVLYKGMLSGTSEKPVVVLGLLQTQVASGVQYATLVPQYIDAIARESYSYLPEAMSLDADAVRVPFSGTDETAAADVHFQFISPTVHYLIPQNGATLALLGIRTASEMSSITLDDLRAASFSPERLDVTDVSRNLVTGFAFAIKTSQGRYAKIRVDRVLDLGEAKDLVLQVAVYR